MKTGLINVLGILIFLNFKTAVIKYFKILTIPMKKSFIIFGDDGATRPLPRGGGEEEFQGDPTVGPRPKVWTRGQKWKK